MIQTVYVCDVFTPNHEVGISVRLSPKRRSDLKHFIIQLSDYAISRSLTKQRVIVSRVEVLSQDLCAVTDNCL